MLNIFNFLNYREYLKAFYHDKKAEEKGFSYQVMAENAGFSSKSFIKLVIDGKKNLTHESSKKLNNVLKLNVKSFSYFKDLVAFNQAHSMPERNEYLKRLFSYRKRNPGRLVLQSHYEFYAQWYHNTIRELLPFFDFKEDYGILGKMVNPPISAREARESVLLLLKLQFIKKEGGAYVQTTPILTTGNEIKSAAVQNFHVQNLALAAASIDDCPGPRRDLSCLVLGLSEEGIERVKKEIQEFRKKLLEIARDDKNPTNVYHYATQFFPTSRTSPAMPEKRS
jgi:uncharacterized protein (TIGR02147 family)